MRHHSFPLTRGIGLVEVVVGVAIVAVALTGLFSAFNVYLQANRQNTTKLQSAFLAEHGIEILRHLRDADWNTLSSLDPNRAHYLSRVGGTWQATTTSTSTNGFIRWFTAQPAYRADATDDIVGTEPESGAYKDNGTRHIAMHVQEDTVGAAALSYTGGTNTEDIANFPADSTGDGNPAQQFETGQALTVRRITLPLARATGTAPSDIYLELRDGQTTGAVVATTTHVHAAALPSGRLTWTPFEFSKLPELSANTTYTLRLRSAPPSTESFSGSSGTVIWGFGQSATSPYALGSAWRFIGQGGDETYQGEELPGRDFSFRIYSHTNGRTTIETYLVNLFE